MSRVKASYYCTACSSAQAKWAGQCQDCGAWNTIREFPVGTRPSSGVNKKATAGYAGEGSSSVVALSSVEIGDLERTTSGMNELDRVLGGGLVPGSVVLIGGDPGIGKSTLLLQAVTHIRREQECLYVTGEESLQQISMRAKRLGLEADALDCLTETCVEIILGTVAQRSPKLLIIDSIQTLYSEEVSSAPGSVSQVRESAAALVRHAKENACTVLLVGHVTKEGSLAGPRVLEHMVDAVLYFESDSGSRYRIVRSIKNRFGTVNELGIFAMTGKGLKQVSNASAIFLTGSENPGPGSVVTVIREGTRPLLLELQALVDQSHLANPRRVAIGLDQNRLAMLLAVLHRHAGISLGDQDVFINVVGGIRLAETGCDLPVALAVASSYRDRPMPPGLVCFGEVGLGGEIRPVFNGEERLKEAATHGFKRAIVPVNNAPRKPIEGLEVVKVSTLTEALEQALG